MSPVSRGRKAKKDKNKKATQRPDQVGLSGVQKPCACPACSGDDRALHELVDDVLACGGDLLATADPLEVEVVGAALASLGECDGAAGEDALTDGLIPEFEARASSEALAMLLALGSVTAGQPGKEAWAAADRLIEAGVVPPSWAAELREPMTVSDCGRLSDTSGTASMLTCSFHRAGRSHAFLLSVDHEDCGAAQDILLLDGHHLGYALEFARAQGETDGLQIIEEELDLGEFRWQVENALDARAVHDGDALDVAMESEPLVDDKEDGPPYPVVAALLRSRLTTLPTPSKPKAQHDEGGRSPRDMLAALLAGEGAQFGPGTPVSPVHRNGPAALLKKRKKSDGPAPIYQIKVGLRDTKPPIWRRLEVPADISLGRLHTIIQLAFDWNDCHMHVFETPYGEFGAPNPDLGHHAAARVTLEQVAPDVKCKIGYTYDFGDDWRHEIVVEKVLDRDNAVTYPRCTGGRRAAPPEDCGGVWGYSDLVEIFADSTHPEHEDVLDWLGLTDPADFDPAQFDTKAVNQELAGLS